MPDFQFIQDLVNNRWVVLAPRRAKRPDVARGTAPTCPFCPGNEKDEQEVYRVGGRPGDAKWPASNALRSNAGWKIRVLKNKFPFAPIHEVIIHSPNQYKNFDALSISQVELIIHTYKQRFITHQDKGQVFIFHNRGKAAGESIPHPHTQLVVIPHTVSLDIPKLDDSVVLNSFQDPTKRFYLVCPKTSQWPDEIWIVPKLKSKVFGEINHEELVSMSFILQRVTQLLELRHGNDFSFNFYIYPGSSWYLRIIPRVKTLGGFEVGTGVFVNTQDPNETLAFLKENFDSPTGVLNVEKIKHLHQAEYKRHV